MEMAMSIASMATNVKQADLLSSVNMKMMKKTMDTAQAQAQAVVNMAQNTPKVQGQLGALLDVRA